MLHTHEKITIFPHLLRFHSSTNDIEKPKLNIQKTHASTIIILFFSLDIIFSSSRLGVVNVITFYQSILVKIFVKRPSLSATIKKIFLLCYWQAVSNKILLNLRPIKHANDHVYDHHITMMV